MRKIDVFTHISPPGYSEGVARVAGDFKDIGKRTRGVPMLQRLCDAIFAADGARPVPGADRAQKVEART